ncbi:hypothetical protein ERAQ111492_02060 [Erysipelothrix aquatica]
MDQISNYLIWLLISIAFFGGIKGVKSYYSKDEK